MRAIIGVIIMIEYKFNICEQFSQYLKIFTLTLITLSTNNLPSLSNKQNIANYKHANQTTKLKSYLKLLFPYI